jgi:peptidoglycan-N-acetylglucosamine deacetylase
MTWSADFLADDWTRINNRQVAQRAISRIEARGKGILLLHDIHARTALALPDILRELKSRGFKIVHVVPATADRPATPSAPEQWAVRRTREQMLWPQTVPVVGAEEPEPVLVAPSLASFGIERLGPAAVRIALAQTLERHATDLPAPLWPSPMASGVPETASMLPIAAAYNFRYSRPFRSAPTPPPTPERHKLAAAKKHPIAARAKTRNGFFGSAFGPQQRGRSRPVGHQLTVARPGTNPGASQVR